VVEAEGRVANEATVSERMVLLIVLKGPKSGPRIRKADAD
jgi:hypothetical protein